MTHKTLGGRREETDAPTIVFAVDETPDERCPNRAIIADITRDDAWIAADSGETTVLVEWR
ncbi:hypothetical protein [Haladaptatus sp. DYF46]|uniref:DUF7556 family protein n=1 Tax=Haladaptatus sp. DYF46 TaxID=2886041 RepID=UPI001E56B6C2|nr:hypothetical protein [Haladaptatus sp. DYF46]